MASLPRDARDVRPIRLLWLIDSLTLGGAESLAAAFAAACDRRRMEVQVCFLKRIGGNPFEDTLRARGVRCTSLEARNLRDVRAFRRLVRLIRDEGVDLLHAHLTYAVIWGVLASRITGRPCVATLHVPPAEEPAWTRPGVRERLMGVLLDRWSAAVIAVSGAVRDAYVSAGRVDPAKIAVVHNGIDCEAFAPDSRRRGAARRQLGLAPETLVVLTVSVLREGKGLDVLLQAARAVVASVPNAVFMVAGDGPSSDALRARAAELGLSERVRWLGFRRDVPEMLAAADLFVLPTLRDALPTALLEAMAAGLAVVASETGGIPEIVEVPGLGRLVPPSDPDALARAITHLLRRPEERAAMGAAARDHVRARFSTRAWIERLEGVYGRALAGAR